MDRPSYLWSWLLCVTVALACGAITGRSRAEENVETWWSLRPLVKPAPPATADAGQGGWARTPIDRFILAKLREKGLSPSPEADKRTLLRRVTFDLIGLPPTRSRRRRLTCPSRRPREIPDACGA